MLVNRAGEAFEGGIYTELYLRVRIYFDMSCLISHMHAGVSREDRLSFRTTGLAYLDHLLKELI